MSRSSKCTGTPTDPSTRIDLDGSHPLANLLKVATNQSLSVEARLLYVILVLMAWSKGHCWPGQEYQAAALGRSGRQVRRYHQELERAGILGINRRPGQSSHYYPWALQRTPDARDLRASDTGVRRTPKQQLQNVNNVVPVPTERGTTDQLQVTPHHANVNALGISSQCKQPIDRQPLEATTDYPVNSPRPACIPVEEQVGPTHIQPPDCCTVKTPPNSFAEADSEHRASPAANDLNDSSAERLSTSLGTQPLETPPHSALTGPRESGTPKTPLTPDQIFLVEEIERVTGDTWSRGHFVNLVRNVPEQTVYTALAITKDKSMLESGVNAGAYFTATLKAIAGLQGLAPAPPRSAGAPHRSAAKPHPRQVRPNPQPLRVEEPPDPEATIKGLRFNYTSGGVPSLLFWADKCTTDVDVQALWGEVRDLLPQENEQTHVDRFLAGLKVRMQHRAAGSRNQIRGRLPRSA